MTEILNLAPHIVWRYFDEITQVPRPSKKEGRIMAYLAAFAKEHKLKTRKDKVGNLVILKPATKGYEFALGIVLQSHVDMVAEKDSGVQFDFEREPIQTYVEDGWVRARGTTLGADDGIGMAAALAVLASDDIAHGPLECLFTVDEETGLTGAFGLGAEMLTGQYLINLDSEDEGEIFIGCAGGIDTVATFKYKEDGVPKNHIFFRIDIQGLLGGHSGDDIEKGHANSNKVLNRFLWHGSHGARNFGLRLSYVDGGNLHNAIPREAYAIFCVPVKEVPAMMEYFEQYVEDIKAEYAIAEKNIDITIAEMPPVVEKILDKKCQNALLDALCGLPNGVLAMSMAMAGLVETSTNLASVKFKEKRHIEIVTSQRSSVLSARDEAAASIESILRLAGADVAHSEGYPGWNPDPDSELLKITKKSYKTLFRKDPKIRAIHAGLECGLFLEKYPHLEMVSFGPTLRGVHSPAERLEIASVDKFWKFLVETLKNIK